MRQWSIGRHFRLIREVSEPTGRGPGNGQYALQKALRNRGADWLSIGGRLKNDEIPWFWCWLDRDQAADCAKKNSSFVIGPNMLFENSRFACRLTGERAIMNAATCRLIFTESDWYRRLIEQCRGPMNDAPIVTWPYPIDPKPGAPLQPTNDLLIFAKSGYRHSLIVRLQRAYSRSTVIEYGRFRRERLFEVARRSRACVYLSNDDRGPLALAEILLAGCPTIGIATGSPFVIHGRTGFILEQLNYAECVNAIEDAMELDRWQIAATAGKQFDTDAIVDKILNSLRSQI